MSCNCELNTAADVLAKVRAKGFSQAEMDNTYEIECECGAKVIMDKFETKCPNCNGIYAVTPCSQDDPNSIVFIDE